AAAAVFLGNRHPHQPELGHLRDEVVGEAALAIELLGDGRDALQRELAHRRADDLGLPVDVEVQSLRRLASSAISRTPEPESARERSRSPGPAMSMCRHGPSPENSRRISAARTAPAWRSSDAFFMSAYTEST